MIMQLISHLCEKQLCTFYVNKIMIMFRNILFSFLLTYLTLVLSTERLQISDDFVKVSMIIMNNFHDI